MKTFMLALVALTMVIDESFGSTWIVDTANNLLSDGKWSLSVDVKNKQITIKAVSVAPESKSDLDFSAGIEDTAGQTGYKVTSISRQGFMNVASVGRVVMPHLTSLNRRTFQSSGITYFQADSLGTLTYADLRNCSSLTEVRLPSCVTAQGGDDTNYGAFGQCAALTTVYAPLLKSLGKNSFRDCSSLQSISLPSATNIGAGAFANCKNLEEIELASENVTIGDTTFNGCIKLRSIVPNVFVNSGTLNYAFQYCAALHQKLKFPNLTGLGKSTFSLSGITELELPAVLTIQSFNYVDPYNHGALYSATNLTKLVFGEGLQTIGGFSIYNCYKLESIEMRSTNSVAVGVKGIYNVGTEKGVDVYINKLPVLNGLSIYSKFAPMRINVCSAGEWDNWKSAVSENDSVFEEYKTTRGDVPAEAQGVYLGCATASEEPYCYHYILRNFALPGTLMMCK